MSCWKGRKKMFRLVVVGTHRNRIFALIVQFDELKNLVIKYEETTMQKKYEKSMKIFLFSIVLNLPQLGWVFDWLARALRFLRLAQKNRRMQFFFTSFDVNRLNIEKCETKPKFFFCMHSKVWGCLEQNFFLLCMRRRRIKITTKTSRRSCCIVSPRLISNCKFSSESLKVANAWGRCPGTSTREANKPTKSRMSAEQVESRFLLSTEHFSYLVPGSLSTSETRWRRIPGNFELSTQFSIYSARVERSDVVAIESICNRKYLFIFHIAIGMCQKILTTRNPKKISMKIIIKFYRSSTQSSLKLPYLLLFCKPILLMLSET